MKANELRIGNWINLRMDVHEWKPIKTTTTVIAEISTVTPFTFEPIPLTEEWLKRFGFDKRVMTINGGEFDWELLGEELILYIGSEGSGFDCQQFERRLKYVHSLQNLYFALTGEELELKE